MKTKEAVLMFLLLVLTACSKDNQVAYSDNLTNQSYVIANIPIDNISLPDSFVYGETYTIDFEYTLPSKCYYYNNLEYSIANQTEINLAVAVYVDLVSDCILEEKQEQNSFIITINLLESYKFKLWTGKDDHGEDTFKEIVIPVVETN